MRLRPPPMIADGPIWRRSEATSLNRAPGLTRGIMGIQNWESCFRRCNFSNLKNGPQEADSQNRSISRIRESSYRTCKTTGYNSTLNFEKKKGCIESIKRLFFKTDSFLQPYLN